jgi:hypothetical protein
VIKRFLAAGAALFCCISCSLYADLRKRTFTYTEGSQAETLRTLVPKRYAKRETFVDSAGNQQEYYRYRNGAFLYFIHTTDTTTLFQPIDTAHHIPLLHPYGGLMYKGLDSAHLFWREIRTDSFRFGYRNVPADVEPLFDSAVNYAGVRRFKK